MNEFLVKESVRGIIEFINRCGSLDNRYLGKNRALEGTYAHQKLQASNEEFYSDYEKEVKLETRFHRGNISINVEGRVDGIIKENGNIIIEEIKSTKRELYSIDENYNNLHWLQGMFYGYMYCEKHSLDNIIIRLSYYNIETNEVKSFEKEYTSNSLDSIINEIIDSYYKWVDLKVTLDKNRNITMNKCNFPFETYRKGQRELAVSIYNTIREKGNFFAQAPTGIGKTISSIFPALKAVSNGYGDKIIYLTAKTITRTVAEEAVTLLKNKGVDIRSITLTSKEKICLNDKVDCNSESCKYADGFFDKINDVLYEMLTIESDINRETIIKYANKYTICPFELSLELTNWCHIVICDYNYAFDPKVRLKRIFEDGDKDNILLIDEAHNLVDRARNMYSSEILKSKFLEISKLIKGRATTIQKIAKSVNKEMIALRHQLEETGVKVTYKNDKLKDLSNLLKEFMKSCDEYLIKSVGTNGYEEVKDLYFEVRNFLMMLDLYDENYTTIIECSGSEVRVKLFCINPSKNLSDILKINYANIFFSATLSPINYYIDILGGDENSYRLRLPSPFKEENLIVNKSRVNMRYEFRERNIPILCQNINDFISKEKGNYLIFLPSYEYLKKVYYIYIEKYGCENIYNQLDVNTEAEKEVFINRFREKRGIVGFCVIGGIFSEGIDLPGDELVGVVVIGVGFPKISIEGDIIKDYFKEDGFNYAYVYPGINKIMQSVGRVIRTENDKGRALLIDDRYYTNKYINLLPKEWKI